MKKLIAIWLCLALVLCACNKTENIDESQNVTPTVTVTPTVVPTTGAEGDGESDLEHIGDGEGEMPEFEGLDDPNIPKYLEDEIYASLSAELGEGEYTIESVDAVWLSKEYLEESAYNQLENIYFGYYLSDVEEEFGGMNYVFTLDENGQTTVEEFEEYDAIKKMAITGKEKVAAIIKIVIESEFRQKIAIAIEIGIDSVNDICNISFLVESIVDALFTKDGGDIKTRVAIALAKNAIPVLVENIVVRTSSGSLQ